MPACGLRGRVYSRIQGGAPLCGAVPMERKRKEEVDMTNILLEKKGYIAVATINRPKALNALNSEVLSDLDELVATVKADDEIRALVITGSGEKAFVAGADIGEMSTLTKEGGTIAAFIDWRNLPAMTDAIQMAGWVWRGVIVWDKGISRNIPGRFRNDCEYIVWGTNGRKEVDWKAAKGAKAMPGIYHINGVNTKQKHHQTEKPVELLKALIQICPRGGP